MTDGHAMWKFILYGFRAALRSRLDIDASKGSKTNENDPTRIPHRPAFVGVHINGYHVAALKELQNMGMTVLAMDDAYSKGPLQDAIPDTAAVGDDEKVAAMPPYVQYFKCGNQIEKGGMWRMFFFLEIVVLDIKLTFYLSHSNHQDPGCGDNKFNNTICNSRRFRTSWHPGWKYHAMIGNIWAMNYLEALTDGLNDLMVEFESVEKDKEDMNALTQRLLKKFDELNQAEHDDYENLLTADFPDDWVNNQMPKWFGSRSSHLEDVKLDDLHRKQCFCHTGRLPAEIRFQGFLTENFTHTTTTIINQTYEKAFSRDKDIFPVEKPNPKSGLTGEAFIDPRPGRADKMVLNWNDKEHQVCEEHLNLDFKDTFLVSSIEGWRGITVPNDSELEYYKEWDPKNAIGYILVCLGMLDRCNVICIELIHDELV